MMKQSTGIGILIRNRRKELGMNQAELSKRSTLSQAHVSRIEAGISYPSVFTILKLAKGLQLPQNPMIKQGNKIKKKKLGSVIGGHIVYSLHASGICLARPIAPDGEYAVWHIDCDGRGVWGGTYFPSQEEAEQFYADWCFPSLNLNCPTAECL